MDQKQEVRNDRSSLPGEVSPECVEILEKLLQIYWVMSNESHQVLMQKI